MKPMQNTIPVLNEGGGKTDLNTKKQLLTSSNKSIKGIFIWD